MRFKFLAVLLACVALAAPIALAQTTGEISGVVRSGDGAPLPGATVTIKGPQMPAGRSTTTRSDGVFRFTALPPGTYHLKVELSGLGAFDQDAIVALGTATEVHPVLRATAREAIEVTAALPLVDTKSTEISKVTTKDTIEKLPLARTFSGTFQLATGVAENNLNSPNAGGARADNQFLYDGVLVTNPFFGELYQDFSELDLKEVAITRAGVTPEYGRTAGFIVNGVTKSGTNDLHGEARLEYQPANVSAKSKDPTLTSQFEKFRPGVDIGGPLWRDHLFGYGSVSLFRQTEQDRVNNLGPVPDNKTNIDEFFTKLTGNPASNHLIETSFRYRGIDQDNAGIGTLSAPSTGTKPKTIDRVIVASWFWTLDPKLSLEAKFNHNENNTSSLPITDLGFLPRFDALHPYLSGNFTTGKSSTTGQLFIYPPANQTGQAIGGTNLVQVQNFFRDEYRFQTSYLANFLGASHDIRIGANYSDNREDLTRRANGWGLITVSDSASCGPVSARPCFRASYSPEQPTQVSKAQTWGVFAQDQMTWNRLTVNLGVLVNRDHYIPNGDKQYTFLSGDFTVPNAQLFPCGSAQANPAACTYTDTFTINWSKQWQPRVGVAYEVFPSVHDKLYANFARYDNLDNQSIARAASPFRLVTVTAFINATTGALISQATNANTTGKKIIPTLDPLYTDEYIGGYSRPLAGGWSVELWGMYRKTQDVIEDFAATGNNFTDLNPGNFRYGNLPGSVRYYKAGTIEVRKAYSDKWTLDASYTLSHLEGNWDIDYDTGLFYASSYIGDGPGLNVTDPTRNGTLIGDRTHVAKVFGTYALPTKTVLGGYFRFQSGRPWEARGYDPVYAKPLIYLESAGSRRLSSWTNFDLSVSQNIPIGPANLWLAASLLNVFNSQPALTVNQIYCNTTANCYLPSVLNSPPTNPDFGRATTYAAPRRLIFTATVTY